MTRFQLDSYDILIDAPWTALSEKIQTLAPGKIALVLDENTRRDCLPILRKAIDISSWHLIEIPSGEQHKSLETCQFIWQSLMNLAFDRNCLLLNLGGGVIGDMGGFCAATFKRGMPFIQIPTTLLSQVDASVGGKLGIDFLEIKNSIGVFRDPELVFIQTAFLKTLPFRELRSGFAEIIKHALIASPMLWEKLLAISDLTTAEWPVLLPEALQVKIDVVRQDPFEKGLRKILNFGHTIGHAIESYLLNTAEPALHGEAIAAGIICEVWISEKNVNLAPETASRIRSLIHSFYPDLTWPENLESDLLNRMKQDKKNRDQQILFVLLRDIGAPLYDQVTEAPVIEESLRQYLSN
ncbi:MAG: 3-dehydroquinate synthase [Saprospiraceae bacterium]|nr:3-dehydroquinate synthase [Saprospiraceae bacterium]